MSAASAPRAARRRRALRTSASSRSTAFSASRELLLAELHLAPVVRLQHEQPERARVEPVERRPRASTKLPSDFDIFTPPTRSPCPRAASAARTGGRRLRPARSRSRGAGRRGRRRRRGGRSPRRGSRATSPSTRCASRAGPRPTATPTPARPASPPSTARSRPGCASARRPRRARPRSRAARRACGATARRTSGSVSTWKYTPWPSMTYAWPARDELGDQLLHLVDELGRVRDLVGPQHVEPVELLPVVVLVLRASSGSVVPRSAARAMIRSSTSVTLLTYVTAVAAPPQVAADRVERRPRCGRDRGAARRTASARTRTSTRRRPVARHEVDLRVAPRCRRCGARVEASRRAIGCSDRGSRQPRVEERDGPDRDALGAADRAEALAALGLHRRRAMPVPIGSRAGASASTSRSAIARDVRRELRLLGRDDDVDVVDPPAVLARPVPRPRAAARSSARRGSCSSHAGNSVPRSGSPAGPSSASATAWATASPSEWPARRGASSIATPPSTSGGVVAERMDVEAEADAVPHGARSRCRGAPAASSRSPATVILRLRGSPGTTTTVPPCGLDQRGVVGVDAPRRVRGAQRVGAERLRRLHDDQSSRGTVVDDAVAVDPLHRVDDRQAPGSRRRRRPRTAAITAANSVRDASGRAASCTTTMSASSGDEREPGPHRVRARRAARRACARRRAVPPDVGRDARRRHRRTRPAPTRRRGRARVAPPRRANCFAAPKRAPAPRRRPRWPVVDTAATYRDPS